MNYAEKLEDVLDKAKGVEMIQIKEMPYSEKYSSVLDTIKREDRFVPQFIQEHLGEKATTEFQKLCKGKSGAIPEDASFEEKYELAYGNWISEAQNIFKFIRGRMSEDGIEKFKRADVKSLKQENDSPAMVILRLIRAFSKGLAFSMTAKKIAYKLQWLSPYSVPELSQRRLVLDIPSCKVLDFEGSEDICLIGCQSIYPIWLAEQFNVDMNSERKGNSCRITISPLR